ncbi:MAG: hypothetical protein ACI9C4_001383, partial [Paraglaciecola sp.]
MDGIAFKVDKDDVRLNLHISPVEFKGELNIKLLHRQIKQSGFGEFFIFDEALHKTIISYQNALKNQATPSIIEPIGERRQPIIQCKIEESRLGATMTITKGFAGKGLAFAELINFAKVAGIVRGLGNKRLVSLYTQYIRAKNGEKVSVQIAKGLPPKMGRPS